ncbi:MAG: hypothetical protein N2689_17950, partial [Verrucomicrobiae bacterium]|nr:hypothetical protein [Verrucomicrobiae bacterium]
MPQEMNRREFISESLLAATAGALAAGSTAAHAQEPSAPAAGLAASLPTGVIGGQLRASRVILGGNLVNLFMHSRELRYVEQLAAQYHTDDRILHTLAVAEEHGINTISLSNRERAMSLLKRHRKERGGKMQWIVCPITKPDDSMTKYREEVERLVEEGADAVYM